MSEPLGPVFGTTFAAVIAGDPMGLVWRPAHATEHARTVATSMRSEVAPSR